MTDRFDDMSKHLAAKHSRRGIFRLLGAGFLGATLATAFSRGADADAPQAEGLPMFNGYFPYFNFNLPQFNHTYPYPKLPKFNGYLPYFNQSNPYFNHNHPYFNHSFPFPPKFN